MMVRKEEPNKPEPMPVNLKRKATAIAVLDLSTRFQDPGMPSSNLQVIVAEFLEQARTYGIPIIFTVSLRDRGTALGEVISSLKRRESEPIIHPDGFDKFTGGELHNYLKQRNIENLIIVGGATNIAVLYTATSAARVYHYKVIIPIDGVSARMKYEQEYAFHQLSTLPLHVATPIQFTMLSMIQFQ